MHKYLALGLCISLLGGCATLDISQMEIMPIEKAEIAPPEKPRTEVLVVPVDDGGFEKAKHAQLPNQISGELKHLIATAGAERVDRSLYEKMVDEFTRCDIKGRLCFRNSTIPDVVLRVELTDVDISANFSERSSYKDKEGKTQTVPASCKHEGEVKGLIHVYAMNYMELEDTIEFSGLGRYKQKTGNSNCPANRTVQTKILQAAVKKAMKSHGWQVKNLFPPQGYVKEYRATKGKNKENYMRISIGESRGAKDGLKAIVYRQEHDNGDYNSQEKAPIRVKIAEGEVVKADKSRYPGAWIQIEDRFAAEQVKLGDLVEVVYTSCPWYRVGWCD